MRRSNVQTCNELIAAFNRAGVDGALPYFAPDCEVYDPDMPAGGTFRGRDALRGMLEMLMSGNSSTEVIDFRVVPAGDRVVALTHTCARGDSGLTGVEVRDAHVMTFAEGKITYWRIYGDQEEALSDVGLDPAEALRAFA